MAIGLAEAGADIIGVSASLALQGSAVEQEVQALGRNFTAYQADFSDRSALYAFIKQVKAQETPVDILVNNAGLTRDNLSMRMKDEEWQEVLDVNLTAPFMLAKAVQRGMMKRRFGRIINISSVVGTTGNPGQCHYVASQAGLSGWTKAMGMEIASRGITVNCVAPGFIATAMTDALDDGQKEKIRPQWSHRR